jgi:hypothetical protein
MTLPPFHFIAILIGEVHLFVLHALPVEKFPSPLVDVSMEGCQPLFVIEHIDENILPLTNTDQVSVSHFHLDSYLIPLLARIPYCCTHQSIPLILNDQTLHFNLDSWSMFSYLTDPLQTAFIINFVCVSSISHSRTASSFFIFTS